MARQSRRQAQLDCAAVPKAGGDRQTLGQQPGSTVEHSGAAAGADVEAGRVDHQRRRPVSAQEPAPGQSDQLACTAALGKARLPHALQPLDGRQRLGPGEARQRAGEGRRGRFCARQHSGVHVEPRRQRTGLAHGDPSSPPDSSASMKCAYRSRRGSGSSVASPNDRQPVTHVVTQAGSSPASTRSMQ